MVIAVLCMKAEGVAKLYHVRLPLQSEDVLMKDY